MTITFMKTTGIPLYTFNGQNYCNLVDVVKLIHHEAAETDDKSLRRILDRMEMRVSKNAFILPDRKAPADFHPDQMPGRYAVAICDRSEKYSFITETSAAGVKFSSDPKKAKLYVNYRDAAACADFTRADYADPEEDCQVEVIDCELLLSEEDRWLRDLLMPFPYDADEGNEESVPVVLTNSKL